MQTPDTAPGNYYVTVRRADGSARCLSGPYVNDHAAALAAVEEAADLACKIDPDAVWYAYGTARFDPSYTVPGILNRLGKMPVADRFGIIDEAKADYAEALRGYPGQGETQ